MSDAGRALEPAADHTLPVTGGHLRLVERESRVTESQVAVIDLGSNTFHLTVARVGARLALSMIFDAKEPVRLVTALQQRRLDAKSLESAHAALRSLVARGRRFGGSHWIAVATSALREADNGAAFIEAARLEHGFPIEVLDATEEGRLVWEAARSEVPDVRGAIAVLDVGGGSVEIAVGRGGTCGFSKSFPLGVLRLRHRYLPPDGIMRLEDVQAITERIAAEAAAVAKRVRAFGPTTLVLTAGTARAIGKLRRRENAGTCDGNLRRDELFSLVSRLCDRKPESLGELGVEPNRSDTLGPGAAAIAPPLKRSCARTRLASDVLLRGSWATRPRVTMSHSGHYLTCGRVEPRSNRRRARVRICSPVCAIYARRARGPGLGRSAGSARWLCNRRARRSLLSKSSSPVTTSARSRPWA